MLMASIWQCSSSLSSNFLYVSLEAVGHKSPDFWIFLGSSRFMKPPTHTPALLDGSNLSVPVRVYGSLAQMVGAGPPLVLLAVQETDWVMQVY